LVHAGLLERPASATLSHSRDGAIAADRRGHGNRSQYISNL
jgi:hypothetical protein